MPRIIACLTFLSLCGLIACAPPLEAPSSGLASVGLNSLSGLDIDFDKVKLSVTHLGDHHQVVVNESLDKSQLASYKLQLDQAGSHRFNLSLEKNSVIVADVHTCTPEVQADQIGVVQNIKLGHDNTVSINLCRTAAGKAQSAGSSNPNTTTTSVSGRQLLVNGSPYFIEGVCWNPVPLGQHQGGKDNTNIMFDKPDQYWNEIQKDIQMMSEAGINTVRTYAPITSTKVLDLLHQHGMKTIIPFYSNEHSVASAVEVVNKVKNHPAVLMYELGNEWNYNKLYANISFSQAQQKIRSFAAAIKQADSTRVISSSYGEVPDASFVNSMPEIQVWGLNVYSGLSFYERFDKIRNNFKGPVYFSEFGADAFDSRVQKEDGAAAAKAVRALVTEIQQNSALKGDGLVSGGTVFEWNDEWWKSKRGSPGVQEKTTTGEPGHGPYPDKAFNEEWWGIVDIHRNPRPAYQALKELYHSYP